MERKRIVVGFGDIRGFRAWTKRPSNPPEVTAQFIDLVYTEFEIFSRGQSYVKFLGDGLMIVQEMDGESHVLMVQRFLEDVYRFSIRAKQLIKKFYPRPEGFRMRVTSGHVWKREVQKVANGHIYRLPEYIGYSVNMAQGLLRISPQTLCICDESITEILGKKKGRIIFESLHVPEGNRSGIDQEDIKGLKSFRLADTSNGKTRGLP